MSFSDHPHIKINPKNNYIMRHSSPGYVLPILNQNRMQAISPISNIKVQAGCPDQFIEYG